MAFKRLENKSELKDLPMLSDYLAELDIKALKKLQGSIFVVESITIAKSGKGYMLNFNSFCTFLFKKSNQATLLNEYIDNNSIGTPCIEIDSDQKYSFSFGIDDEIPSKIHWVTDSIGKVNQMEKLSSTVLQSKKES